MPLQDLKGSLLIVTFAVALAAFLFGIEVIIPTQFPIQMNPCLAQVFSGGRSAD